MNRTFVTGLVSVALLGCSTGDQPGGQPDSATSSSTTAVATASVKASASSVPTTHPPGDAARGRKLVEKFECHRCHDGLDDLKPMASERHCFRCHKEVLEGRFKEKADHKRWKKNVDVYQAAPSLAAAGKRLEYQWVVGYLLEPHDLRPNMVSNMPRLPLDPQQARDIATYLRKGVEPTKEASLEGADTAAGRKLMEKSQCGKCHIFSGVEPLPEVPNKKRETRTTVQLAPDLRHARARLDASTVVDWLLDPLKMKPNTEMPQTPMSREDARNIAAYILTTKLTPPVTVAIPELPKPLDRRVTYDEIAKKLFDVTCRHCHGNPDVALGDGGPGNSGGFGFKPRGVELTSYQRVAAGYLDDAGERHSLFKKMKDNTPRLIATLMARHAEIAGKPNPEIRGMPLGLPPIPIEDIQLLVTWVAQGRPR